MPEQTDINTANLTINEINERKKQEEKRRRRQRRTHVIVALLIATVIELPLAFFGARYYIDHRSGASGEVCDFTTPWYEQYNIVNHALGTIDGRVGTNSKEAFIDSYERGARVFEADLCLTADGYLVVRHDFTGTSYYNLEQSDKDTDNGEIIYGTYMHTKICYLYTPLDIDGMLALMEEYPDTYLVTDTKYTDEKSVKEEFRRLNEAIERTGDKELYQRIIVQIYSFEMLDWVKQTYNCPSENFILTLYLMYPRDYDDIGTFCRDNGIPIVTMANEIAYKANVSKLHDYGLKVYTHTENKINKMFSNKRYIGVDGFYSDSVTPSEYLRAYNAVYGNDPELVYSDEEDETLPVETDPTEAEEEE